MRQDYQKGETIKMSHACVLVAVDVDPSDRVAVEEAVQLQMAPYDENDHWFRDGSRWDWYVIGGRFTGQLSDYDPSEDPRNMETCSTCGGTGIRPGGLAEFGQAWFDGCKGCNGCHGEGRRLAWNFVPFAGDIVRVKYVSREHLKACSAFLHEHHWHEAERLGWFGTSAATECEIKAKDDPDVLTRKCSVTTGNENARIVVWNEPWEIWSERFVKRFIEPLRPDTTLVVVDYHV